MLSLSLENSDTYGREGKLEIENKKISTPMYIPTRNEFLNLKDSNYVSSKDYKNVNFGVHGHWLDQSTLKRISSKKAEYDKLNKYINGRIKIIETPLKMLHFEFKSDVLNLNNQTLKLLLDLQYSAGAQVIEIPNLPCSGLDYKKILDKSIEWKKQKAIDSPLMGIAYEPKDVKLIKSKIKNISSLGIHMHSENYPLLYEIEETIRPLDIWIHAFSVPRSYKKSNYKGTMGMFLNKFGVDTVSTYVAPSEVARNYSYENEKKTKEEKMESAKTIKYFNPVDYSTNKYLNLCNPSGFDENFDINLSDFCSCPICKNNSLKSITLDYDSTLSNTRSHEVLANIKESITIQAKIKNNEFDTYLSSKKFAYRLTQRSQTKLPS